MSDRVSEDTQQKSGIIPAWGPMRVWFSAGVILGGAGMAAALTAKIGAARAITAGLVSAITLLVAFDRVGDFKVARAIPAIVFAVIGASVLQIPVVGGLAGFIGFMIIGWLAVGVGRLIALMLPKSMTANLNRDFSRGVNMLSAGEAGSALAAFQKSLEEAVGDRKADSLYNIAVCHVRLGSHDAALEALRQAVAIDPRQASEIGTDEDFALLRSNDAFKEIVKISAPPSTDY